MSSSEEKKNNSELSNMSKQPWFDAAYKSALAFYQKDDQLDSKDRLDLSRKYESIANAELFGGWLGFTSVFLPPFFWQFYKTNAIKGVNVPKNFIAGLLVMFGSTQLSGNYMFSKKMKELDPNGTFKEETSYDDDTAGEKPVKSSAQRQWEMMNLLNNGGATKWAAYFSLTYYNPERRLPDPRIKLAEMNSSDGQTRPGGLLQHKDIMGLYTGPEAEKRRREGIPEKASQQGEEPTKPALSSWDAIRAENNLPSSSNSAGNGSKASGSSWDRIRNRAAQQDNYREEDSQQANSPNGLLESDQEDPFASLEHPSQSEFDALLDKERHGGDEK
ncbi:YIL077C [Zygosaccharomyces parabailii]|uniref:ZYBA0S04-02410g1_1 n=1 Tax=Zygosaccharomyces bailii (strain CLIB 213 / ATCC 58445 / CBS 680 / BCRC 21525 / NBRC 1098 / NCYC 1416 / NRRL Y-2227) TaxID=1333698 RepID=A0A8J2T6T4_ZYGB2|nr:YIL077C [Zygosaccharomyces parabailii]CDF89360.1 ZYBA0S04-02410g1_1 [Zygosaccharomyces bailii CLIB 213]SJM85742.1 uncharacterized protein ZBIST_2440 [Zygosaccharomyces bailii]